MFWILAALMTVAVAIVLLVPLARRPRDEASEQAFDLEVYRDQLREIDRDVENNLISPEEAEFARAEVGRRLIKVSKQAERASAASGGASWVGRVVVIVLLPAIAIVGYLSFGNPGMPSQPFAARQHTTTAARTQSAQQGRQDAPVGPSIETLVAQAESHLASNPDDGKGWDVVAPIYMRLGRLPQAETAYRNAIRLLGSTAIRQAGLGQALFAQAGGVVTPEARTAFKAVLRFEPQNPFASYFMALALAQEGKRDEALQAFTEITQNSPTDAPWMPAVRQQVQLLTGPDSDQVEAAMEMAPQQRQEMIAGMVAGLDARLQENPDDIEGWLRLIRSYIVLGQADDAMRALGQALGSFQDGTSQQLALKGLAAELGLDMTGLSE